VGLGLTVDHVSGGRCDSGNGFVGDCDGRWGSSLWLEAGQAWPVGRLTSFVSREAIGGGLVAGTAWRALAVGHGTTWLARAYLGAGARMQVSPESYVELTAGVEPQLGTTGTGDGGIASGSELVLVPRAGMRFGCWSVVLEGLLAPGASGQLGLADYGAGVLASRTFGD
jgi:hypothetical protein